MAEKLPELPPDKPEWPDEPATEAIGYAALYRQDCPDSLVLGEYRLGLLGEDQRQPIKVHLAHCHHCQAELAYMTEFLAEEEQLASFAGLMVDWIESAGFRWRQVHETGQVIIQLLAGALGAGHLQPEPMGIKGVGQVRESILSHLALDPDQAGDLALEVTLRHSPDPQHGILVVRVERPSHWPNLAGTPVRATAGDWEVEGTTNEEGEIIFEALPLQPLADLTIEVWPPSG